MRVEREPAISQSIHKKLSAKVDFSQTTSQRYSSDTSKVNVTRSEAV